MHWERNNNNKIEIIDLPMAHPILMEKTTTTTTKTNLATRVMYCHYYNEDLGEYALESFIVSCQLTLQRLAI